MVDSSLYRHFGRCPLLPLLAALATTMAVLTPSTAISFSRSLGSNPPGLDCADSTLGNVGAWSRSPFGKRVVQRS